MKNITHLLIFTALLNFNAFGQSIANYNISFESIWESVDDNPTDGQSTIDLPGNAHWSALVIATHKTANTFLEMGQAASLGIEQVAETGGTTTFKTEVESNSDADQFIQGSGLSGARGTINVNNISISEDFSFVSLASMIAPSPDWFIAINSMNLRSGNPGVNNGWKDTFSVDLFPYDAGTEDGSGYSGSNPDSNPIGVITSRSNTTPFNTKKIGTLTFTYNSSTLSTNTKKNIHSLKLFPNPTKGKITISNIQGLTLKHVKVYNIIGKEVKTIPVKNDFTKLNIDLSTLKKGIYLLNIKAVNGNNKTQKLIIH